MLYNIKKMQSIKLKVILRFSTSNTQLLNESYYSIRSVKGENSPYE